MHLLLFQFARGFVATLWAVGVLGVLFASDAVFFLVYVEQDASRQSRSLEQDVPRNFASHPWVLGRWTLDRGAICGFLFSMRSCDRCQCIFHHHGNNEYGYCQINVSLRVPHVWVENVEVLFVGHVEKKRS